MDLDFGRKSPYEKLKSNKHGFPALWIDGGDEKIYLVNNSNKVIANVSSSSGGFTTSDDDVVVSTSSEGKYHYKKVEPDSSVLIEELDGYYDLDYVHQLFIKIEDKYIGHIEIATRPDKGRIPTQTIIWEDGSFSEKVSVTELPSFK